MLPWRFKNCLTRTGVVMQKGKKRGRGAEALTDADERISSLAWVDVACDERWAVWLRGLLGVQDSFILLWLPFGASSAGFWFAFILAIATGFWFAFILAIAT